MGMLSELNNLLDTIPLWKRLKSVPDEVEQLKQRIAELEVYIQAKPGDKCPKCGMMSYSLDRTEPDPTFHDLGVQRDVYSCSKCGYETFKQR
ncbi:hypothetical protein [Xenorhabdus bovienii]|uniref:Uncharacterized protein n=1 Tax=Xenorhabdus bovienii str. feltiae Moldova TaxID=1398200 RepID=A0A077NI24_XENBV|nr:hypothetical protein [Xenorhabdus bovienii]MCG3461520.1 hypothetical protein [Xenorhabdus bovienii]CDH01737.1 conserved hypothetical protein [Xenorhabdus bovienii str. feltiae Moldova]